MWLNGRVGFCEANIEFLRLFGERKTHTCKYIYIYTWVYPYAHVSLCMVKVEILFLVRNLHHKTNYIPFLRLALDELITWEFLKIGGTLFWGPYIRILLFRVLY